MSVDLSKRDRQPELMDDPGLDPNQHRDALRGLRRVNWISRSVAMLWPAVESVARQVPDRPVRILDIASGGGDVVTGLAVRAKRQRIAVDICGCDISPFAVQQSRELADRRRVQDVEFVVADILDGSLQGPFDIVMCSLFLHHLDEEDARRLLVRMRELAVRCVLVNDLVRSRAGYVLAWLGCRLLTRSPIVHVDGPLSVRSAFSVEEVRQLAAECGLDSPAISLHWPPRFLLDWRRR